MVQASLFEFRAWLRSSCSQLVRNPWEVAAKRWPATDGRSSNRGTTSIMTLLEPDSEMDQDSNGSPSLKVVKEFDPQAAGLLLDEEMRIVVSDHVWPSLFSLLLPYWQWSLDSPASMY